MKTKPNKNILRFRRLGVTSVIAVYLLIFVGGVVRSSGSGMGCPDWPKCFGEWVPPTAEAQLPDDYKELYSQKRKVKNEKLARMLTSFGAENSAGKILGDSNTYIEDDFNATKTWVEYVNRLIGAVIGILLFALFISALPLIKIQKSLAAFSGLIFIVTGFQGWLGSIVVSTNLLPGMITIHMLLALVIISFLIVLVFSSYDSYPVNKDSGVFSSLKPLLIILLITLIPQIVLGTDVRENIDILAKNYGFANRASWVDELGISFYIHRSLSWLFLGIAGFVFYRVFKNYGKSSLEYKLGLGLLSLVTLEIAFGIGMYLFEIPPFIQPFHLLVGTLLFGFVLFMILVSQYSLSIQKSHE